MPRPPTRGGEISGEIVDLFERALQLRALGAHDDDADEALHDELVRVEKRLVWTLLPRIWPEWGPHCPSPADDVFDGECFLPNGCGYVLANVWPKLQEHRRALLAALAKDIHPNLDRSHV
jgi:hypothetical protein